MSQDLSTPGGESRAAIEAALELALRETSAQTVLFSQAVADHVGLNATDLEALDLLVRHGPMTAGRLAELTGLTTGAVTGLVDRLERRGYVRREPHPSDRRSVMVRPLTEVALQDLEPCYAPMSEAMAELCQRFSDAELTAIADFVARAAVITEELVAKLRSQHAKQP
jgi:DNA-binding MarR family transcriptional regulator